MRHQLVVFCLAKNTDESNIPDLRDEASRCAVIDSLGINNTPESTGVTTFVQEACEAIDIASGATNSTSLYSRDDDVQDLTDYFRRPVAISAAKLPTSTLGSVVNFDVFPSTIFGAFKHGILRLTGVYGVRCTCVFTLQVSSTPFHQGLLALAFQYGPSVASSETFIRTKSAHTVTNLPHVRLDLSTDTMVQLRVPFLYPFEYFCPTEVSMAIPLGHLALTSVLPIQSVDGVSAPSYQIFLHLEDLELFGAAPQSTVAVQLQAGKKLTPVTEEFENEAYPFSSSTMALSRSVKWIAKGVPMLSSVAGPTSWFLEKMSGAIRAFGFSRPQIRDPIGRMLPHDSALEHNVDMASPAVVVGPLASNTLRHGPEFSGTEVDEMALSYVLSRWSQINRFTLPTTHAAGTLVYACPISPCAFWFRSTDTTPACNVPPPILSAENTNSFQPSNLFYFGQMFKLWRGTIKFRFTFAKTKMHGGRVMVCYRPGFSYLDYGSTRKIDVPYYGNPGPDPFGYSAVFNLRDSNVFEFEVPYINSSPYVPFSAMSGALAMYVVDPLLAPTAVAPVASVMVEVAAGSDFELSNVKTPDFVPAVCGTVTLQSGKLLSQAPASIAEYTVGESITSLKQLIAIPKTTVVATDSIDVEETKVKFLIPPWYYQPIPSALTPGPTGNLSESFGFGGSIAACFAFVKGGTDFHAYMGELASMSTVMSVSQISGPSFDPYVTGAGSKSITSNPRLFCTGNTALHARLPAYQHCVRLRSFDANSIVPTGSSWGVNATRLPVVPRGVLRSTALYQFTMSAVDSFPNPGSQYLITSRAASDDASCGMFMGPPPLLTYSSNAMSPFDVDDAVLA